MIPSIILLSLTVRSNHFFSSGFQATFFGRSTLSRGASSAIEHQIRAPISAISGSFRDSFSSVQAAVPILDDDTVETLSARIVAEEQRIYAEAINLVLSGKFRIEERRVIRTG